MAPEFNAVDASLWYVIAASELLNAVGRRSTIVSRDDRKALETAILKIVAGYAAGTRFGIRTDDDGLLAAGVPGVQLTWMDARVGDRVITPRIGKPVEIQALWLNALNIAAGLDRQWRERFERGLASFPGRFWNDERDAEPPFTPRGCPFQAWSLGEFLRVQRVILAAPKMASVAPLRT
jgi:predicted glycogen debranching enzyme